MRTTTLLSFIFALATFSTNLCQAAPTDNATQAEALIREGIELRRLSDDQAALVKFQAAVKLEASPRAVAQLGLCELAVGRFSHAVEHLTTAMHATKDKWVTSKKAILRESLEQGKARVGRVEVVADPQGAEVSINGELIGTAPFANAVLTNEGSVDVQVRKEGFEPQSRSLSIKGGQYQKLAITLERVKPKAIGPTTSVASAPSADADVVASATVEQPGWVAPTKWSLLGAAGLGVALGTYGWIHHQSLVSSYGKAGCQVNRQGEPGTVSADNTFSVTEDCTKRLDDVEGAKTLRLVGFVAGGAFLVGYVALAVIKKSDSTEQSTSQNATVRCAVGLASIGCAGSF